MDLLELRKEIDKIDNELISLLEKRMDVVVGIAQYKREHNLAVYDPVRERQKILSLKDKTRPQTYQHIADCMQGIMDASKRYEHEKQEKIYGLLGRKLGHSFSPKLHKLFGGYDYALIEKEPEEVGKFLHEKNFAALNVTIPYKQAVIPYLDELSDVAKRTNSVNVIVKKEDGTLFGDNSDYFGLKYSIMRQNVSLLGKKVLILGDGGVAAMVKVLLSDLNVKSQVTISRRGENNYQNINRHYDADAIINTTPVGMYPNNGEAVIDLSLFKNCTCVIDLIFNPLCTKLLQDAKALGMTAINGLDMLTAQAARACERFLDIEIPTEKIDAVCDLMLRDAKNIVLIGMPGCGKTTVAKSLSEITNRELVDTDAEIEKLTGKKPGDIIKESGENEFRKIETEVIREVSKKTGVIISCGGGVVTRPENEPLLHQNGEIYYISRELSKLDKTGRPLSAGNLEELFLRRKPMYEAFADVMIDNNGSVNETVNLILKGMNK